MLRVLAFLLLLQFSPGVDASFAAGDGGRIDELTRRLKTHARSQSGGLEALRTLAHERRDELAALLADHPDLVLQHALSAKERAMLPADVQDLVESDEDTEGDLEVLHEDGATGSRYHYFLDRGTDRLSLHFAKDAPALQTGDRVRVAGLRVGQALTLGSAPAQLTVLATALPNTFGAQNTAVILVNFQDKPTETWLTPAQARDVVFGPGSLPSVSNFYLEGSYQQTWLAGDVYGVFTIPVSSTVCNSSAIATAAQQVATAQVGSTKMATYTRFVYAFPRNACGWWGLATIGGQPSRAWINGIFENTVVAHEMGHNLGLFHSHALDCGSTTIGSTCTHLEYGDALDVMGSATPPRHYNAVQKELLGWLGYGSSPPITTVQASGVYALDPYVTPGPNPKALKIPTPSGDWYYVEYRQPVGFDAGISTNVRSGVLVHLWSAANPDGIYLLDMTPSTTSWQDPALTLNNTFSDPAAAITITPTWLDSTAGVSVTIGGGVSCVRNNPSVTISPTPQPGLAGATLSYTISVTNNDTACPVSSFAQQATVPGGWTASVAAPTLSIAAGATASTTMQVTSAASATAGSYSVSLSTSNTSTPPYAGSTTGTCTVTAPSGGDGGGSFTDDFDRPDASTLGNGWSQITGGLALQAAQARNNPVKMMHTAVQPGVSGTTQTVSARFASADNNRNPRLGLVVRYKSAQNYHVCYRQAGGSSVLRIAKVTSGIETVLASGNIGNPTRIGADPRRDYSSEARLEGVPPKQGSAPPRAEHAIPLR